MHLKDNQRHGQGVFFYSDGARYDGGWENNRRSGHGVMTYENGEVRILPRVRPVHIVLVTLRRE